MTKINDLLEKASQNNHVYNLFKEFDFDGCNELKVNNKSKDGKISSLSFPEAELKQVFKLSPDYDNMKLDNRICTLHSSALVCFLCFHNVSNELPFIYNNVKYIKANFEVKKEIKGKKGHAPQLDIVLYDGNTQKESKNILLLESKFSEYLDPKSEYKISIEAYRVIYDSLKEDLNKMGLEFVKSDEKHYGILRKIKGVNNNKKFYCSGIKQMICHYLGVQEFANANKDKNILLGTILFDLKDVKDVNPNYFKDYVSLYPKLASALNKLSKKEKQYLNLTVIPEVLTYQNLFQKENSAILDDRVKEFYKL